MRKLRLALIAVIVILSLAAFKTATPAADASKACLLGYKAFCSFTPVSTLILAIAAIGIFFATREIVFRRIRLSMQRNFHPPFNIYSHKEPTVRRLKW